MKKFLITLFLAVCLLSGSVFADVSVEKLDTCNWQTATTGGTPSLSNLNWSGPIRPLAPIKVFDRQVIRFQIGKFGQLKFLTYPDGRFNYSDQEFELPESITELKEGYQVIGFGEPLKIKGCGATASHGLAGSNYVIEFNAIHLYTGLRQRWQYVFPLKQHNIIIVNYRSVVTGHNTIVGAVGEPGTGDQWYPLETHQYRNTAILIDTNAEATDEVTLPNVDTPYEPDQPPAIKEWGDIDSRYEYRIQRRLR